MAVPENLWALSRWFYRRRLIAFARALKAINLTIYGNQLAFQARVGPDVRLGHHGTGVVIHPNTVIGARVHIWHGVTIAAETQPGSEHFVYIGDDAMIGAGAIIVARADAGLVIGPGARVGAGAVVTRDVEPSATVVGNPARPILP